MACMEGLPVKLTYTGKEMDPYNAIAGESVVCGFTFYFCIVLWSYVFRKRACCDCKSSTSMIAGILLASSCVLILVSEIIEILAMVYTKEYMTAMENYCISLRIVGNAKYFSNVYDNSSKNLSELLRYCNVSALDFDNYKSITGCPESERLYADRLELVGRYCCMGSYAISVAIIYGVIWHRQRSIYRKPPLSKMFNKITKAISKYLIIYVIFLTSTVVFIFMYYLSGYSVSSALDETTDFPKFTILMLLYPWSIQLPMLILFVLPLIRIREFNRTSKIATDQKHLRLIKRLIVVTSACLVSDTALAVSTRYFIIVYHSRFIFTHVNFTINLVCVHLLAADWKSRLFPWFSLCCKTSHPESTINSGVTCSVNVDSDTRL